MIALIGRFVNCFLSLWQPPPLPLSSRVPYVDEQGRTIVVVITKNGVEYPLTRKEFYAMNEEFAVRSGVRAETKRMAEEFAEKLRERYALYYRSRWQNPHPN